MQRAGNPLFRVRYAHARARALTRNAAALGFTGTPVTPNPLPAPLTAPDVTTPLVTALTEYPSALARAATHRAPDRLARHLVVLADALLAFQHTVLPRGDEKPSAAHRARLALAEAAGTVLAAACPCSASTHPHTSERARGAQGADSEERKSTPVSRSRHPTPDTTSAVTRHPSAGADTRQPEPQASKLQAPKPRSPLQAPARKARSPQKAVQT